MRGYKSGLGSGNIANLIYTDHVRKRIAKELKIKGLKKHTEDQLSILDLQNYRSQQDMGKTGLGPGDRKRLWATEHLKHKLPGLKEACL